MCHLMNINDLGAIMPYATYACKAGIQVKSISLVNNGLLVDSDPIELG